LLAFSIAAPAADDAHALDGAFAQCLAVPAVASSDNTPRPKPAAEAASESDNDDDSKREKVPPPPKLETVCPALVEAVTASDFGRLLPDDWHDVISSVRLADLRVALAASRESPAARRLSTDTLRPVLARLDEEQSKSRPSQWERFKRWVRSLFERQEQLQKGGGWFSRLLRNIDFSPSTTRILNYSLLALLIGAAIAIVVIELRAAGKFTRAGGTGPGKRRTGAAGAADAGLTLADVAGAPLPERPTLLIRLLVERCVATGRLNERRSFTHRELERAAKFDAESDRNSFSQVLSAAEAVRFAGRAPDAEALDRAVRDGQALLTRLTPGPGAAQ
jgi:hypothetical protein